MSDYLKPTAKDIADRARAEAFCANLLMERHPQTLMDKRKQRSFSLIDPRPKTNFDEKP